MTSNFLPNIPWQERPSGSADVVWRYNSNPIIPRDLIPSSNSIFNSAVVPFNGKFAGVFRCDNKKREMNLNRGFSDDGLHWKLDNEPICWECDDPEIGWFQYRYDPRVVWIEDRYYVTWCNGYHGPPLALATRMTSNGLPSWKMLCCRSTATACSSHARSRTNT